MSTTQGDDRRAALRVPPRGRNESAEERAAQTRTQAVAAHMQQRLSVATFDTGGGAAVVASEQGVESHLFARAPLLKQGARGRRDFAQVKTSFKLDTGYLAATLDCLMMMIN